MTFKLRPYQEDAHALLVKKLKQKLKTLLVMPTGAGKSKTIVSFIKKYEKHFTFILVVQNRKLVNQLAEDTKLFGLDYGVFMADHDDLDLSKEIQVCSIDTINTRGVHPHIEKEKDIILIIDEADQATSAKFQNMINRYMSRTIARTFLIGLTATPYNGLDFFDCYIQPTTALELREEGFLVDYRYYIPKESVDYSDIIISKGEWSTKQVEAKLNTPSMIKSCFESWLRFGENRQTLVFCVNKQHAEATCEYINNYYQRKVAYFIYDKTSDEERNEIINKFNRGEAIFIVNIRIITRGVDIPMIGCILDQASTLKLNLHIQKLGRGSRVNGVYKDCIVIDPAKNVLNLGHFYQVHEINLSKPFKRTKKDLEVLGMKTCSACFRADEPQVFKGGLCPYCGFQNKVDVKPKMTKYQKDKIFMESASEEAIEQRKIINEFKKVLWKKQNLGKKYGYNIAKIKAHIELLDKYGLNKILKIQKSIGLQQNTIEQWQRGMK